MGKWIVLVIVGVVLVGGVVGFVMMSRNKVGNEVKTSEETLEMVKPADIQISPTSEPVTNGETKEFVVSGSNFKFSPNVISVKRGDIVKLVFKVDGGIHDFVIDEYEVATNQLGDGEEEEVEFVADKVGTFEYYCSVGKHRQNGMVGKLIVE